MSVRTLKLLKFAPRVAGAPASKPSANLQLRLKALTGRGNWTTQQVEQLRAHLDDEDVREDHAHGDRPTLGDKIQRLGMKRPGFFVVLEGLVDGLLSKAEGTI